MRVKFNLSLERCREQRKKEIRRKEGFLRRRINRAGVRVCRVSLERGESFQFLERDQIVFRKRHCEGLSQKYLLQSPHRVGHSLENFLSFNLVFSNWTHFHTLFFLIKNLNKILIKSFQQSKIEYNTFNIYHNLEAIMCLYYFINFYVSSSFNCIIIVL